MLSLQIFVLSSTRIQQRGYDTLFRYTTANPKSGVSRWVKRFPTKAQVSFSGPICFYSAAHCFPLVASGHHILTSAAYCFPLVATGTHFFTKSCSLCETAAAACLHADCLQQCSLSSMTCICMMFPMHLEAEQVMCPSSIVDFEVQDCSK